MSRSLGDALPKSIRRQVESEDPASIAVPVVTIDDGGRPHVALLSYFEIGLGPDGCLLLWLHSGCRSVRWLRQRPACTLIFASEEGVFYVKSHCREAAEREGVTVLTMDIEDVLEDVPTRSEGDTALSSGLRFRLPDGVRRAKLRLKSEILARPPR